MRKPSRPTPAQHRVHDVAHGIVASAPTSAEILQLRMQLLDNGWNIVPSSPSDKACYVRGWPVIETNGFHLSNWEWSFPAHTNTAAVGNKNYFAVDIDVRSDPQLAHRIQALAFEYLGITPFIRVGQWPKRLLVYQKRYDVLETYDRGHSARISSPAVSSDAFKAANGSGDGIEILSSGKQFVINGFHWAAGQPYRWVGEAHPLEDTPKAAPLARQGLVDEFLAAVEEIMPLTSASSGRAGNGGETARHANTDGLIDDGRESLLRDCIWQAAHEIKEQGDAPTAQAVANRGWELFGERAWNGDNKYRYEKHAMEKARSLIRRLGDGRVQLGGTDPGNGIKLGNGWTAPRWGRKRIRLLRRPPLARTSDTSLDAIRARVRRDVESACQLATQWWRDA